MIEIQVRDGHLEEALISLRRQCQKDGDLKLLKRRQDHPNLTDRRKIKMRDAEKRRKLADAKRERQRESMARLRRSERKIRIRGRWRA